MICASAPALKVFFRRYFKLTNFRANYSETGSRETQVPPSTLNSRGKGSRLPASEATAGGTYDDEVPMDGIKDDYGLDIHVDKRDGLSQFSFASVRNLGSLAMSQESGWQGSNQWIHRSHTVCAALRPSSRGSSGTRSREKDVEAGMAR